MTDDLARFDLDQVCRVEDGAERDNFDGLAVHFGLAAQLVGHPDCQVGVGEERRLALVVRARMHDVGLVTLDASHENEAAVVVDAEDRVRLVDLGAVAGRAELFDDHECELGVFVRVTCRESVRSEGKRIRN